MQLFGGKYEAVYGPKGSDDYPRNNFDSLFSAFLTIFQVLAGEDWNIIMYKVFVTWYCHMPARTKLYISMGLQLIF